MQSALGFGETRPTTGARIFTGTDSARAMRAADAWIILIVQFIVWDVVVVDVAPDLLGSPVHDRIDFHEIELRVPLNSVRTGSGGGLVAANTGNPSVQLAELPAEWFDLTQAAAEVGVATP